VTWSSVSSAAAVKLGCVTSAQHSITALPYYVDEFLCHRRLCAVRTIACEGTALYVCLRAEPVDETENRHILHEM